MMSGEQWHAEILVSDELVKTCLTEQFPTLPLHDIQCIGEGWDNKVYLINKNLIFRFPHRHIAVPLIERENAVLTKLQSIRCVEIPHPIYLGKPSLLYPYPFHGYKKIPGQSGCHAHLTMQEREASITIMANFLKQLHSINATHALKLGAKSQVYDRTNVEEVVASLTERVSKIIAQKLCTINMAQFQIEMQSALKIKLDKEQQCLIHGDLYCRHLMFNQGHLTGTIDWGDVGINNKSVDLAVIWSFYPQRCHPEFFELYGPVDPATWQYARFLALHSGLTVILYASDMGDKLLVAEAINSIKRINPNLIAD